jgi:hypothetical protein
MKRYLLLFLLPLLILVSTAGATPPEPKPKLVVMIVVDQFRYDYLTRFRDEYKGGLNQLMTRGAFFTDANFRHFPTVTAIGHSVVLTGAMPSVSGIVGNDWYDQAEGRRVTSVSDDAVKILGGRGGGGASPHRLLASSVGDELKAATMGKARVIGISIKDRAAILPAGHAADAAYWFDSAAGMFVSSSFYMKDLPNWVKDFNRTALDKYRGAEWVGGKLPEDARLGSAIIPSPFGNEVLEDFAEKVVKQENLGKDDIPDLFSVSFSSNDYVGHGTGPDSPEVHAICLETDQMLARFFRFLDSQVGLNNTLIILTADHGVADLPEANASRRVPGGRMPGRIIQDTVLAALTKKYGEGRWILSTSEHSLYLNQQLVQERNLDRTSVEETVRETVLPIPHVFRVYTRTQLMRGEVGEDVVGQCVLNGFFQPRAADVYILLEPSWMFGSGGTTHGTAFTYDTHVPLIFMGPWIKSGIYDEPVVINDVAVTLAAMLETAQPSGAAGRILSEILMRDSK